jgi:hypothetical protein
VSDTDRVTLRYPGVALRTLQPLGRLHGDVPITHAVLINTYPYRTGEKLKIGLSLCQELGLRTGALYFAIPDEDAVRAGRPVHDCTEGGITAALEEALAAAKAAGGTVLVMFSGIVCSEGSEFRWLASDSDLEFQHPDLASHPSCYQLMGLLTSSGLSRRFTDAGVPGVCVVVDGLAWSDRPPANASFDHPPDSWYVNFPGTDTEREQLRIREQDTVIWFEEEGRWDCHVGSPRSAAPATATLSTALTRGSHLVQRGLPEIGSGDLDYYPAGDGTLKSNDTGDVAADASRWSDGTAGCFFLLVSAPPPTMLGGLLGYLRVSQAQGLGGATLLEEWYMSDALPGKLYLWPYNQQNGQQREWLKTAVGPANVDRPAQWSHALPQRYLSWGFGLSQVAPTSGRVWHQVEIHAPNNDGGETVTSKGWLTTQIGIGSSFPPPNWISNSADEIFVPRDGYLSLVKGAQPTLAASEYVGLGMKYVPE